MSNNIYTPYTYLIGWSRLNWWYYGVRFANGYNPSDLWIKYFTSSKEVGRIRTVYGEPDVIQIRKTFDCPEKARNWESKVLTRLKVVGNPKWLNKTNNKAIEGQPGKLNPFFGKKHTSETIKTITEKNVNKIPWNKGLTKEENLSLKIYSDRMKINNPSFHRNQKGKNNPVAISVSIENKIYETLTEAAKTYNVCITTVKNRIKSKKPIYNNWFLIS